jgi:transducin (beta)-like 1
VVINWVQFTSHLATEKVVRGDEEFLMAISMEAVNSLVWHYLQESGFSHTAFLFRSEALLDEPLAESEMPGALVSVLQRSLLYMQLEKEIAYARQDPSHPAHQRMIDLEEAVQFHAPDITLSRETCTLLQSHHQGVFTCKWSPDGARLATAGTDGTTTIWVLRNGAEVDHVILSDDQSTTQNITALDWTPFGNLIVTASFDSVVRVYSNTGPPFFRLKHHSQPVYQVKFSPSGQFILSCSADTQVIVWLVDTGRILRIFSRHVGPVLDIDWKDDRIFASASADGTIRLCGIDGSEGELVGHKASVIAVAWSPDRRLLASASEDQTVRIWRDKGEPFVLSGHNGGVLCIKWIPGRENRLVSASDNGSVRIWDAERGECLRAYNRHSGDVLTLAVHPSGNWVASGGTDQIIDIADVGTGDQMAVFRGKSRVFELQFDASGYYLAVCFDDSSVAVIPIMTVLTV